MEKLQYVGGFAVRCWFLKWNCFFLSLNKAVSWFWDEMVHCMEVGVVGTKLGREISYGFIFKGHL